MVPRSGRPSWIRWWAAAALVTSGLGAAWAEGALDACPTPTVIVPAYGADSWLEELASNTLTQHNAGSVRFVSYLHPALAERGSSGDEYHLAALESEHGTAPRTITLSLTDPKGRPVASATASASPAGRDPSELDQALADEVAATLTPLRELIGAHQRRVREAGIAAIDARISADPTAFALELGEEQRVRFELVDCDGYALADRTVQIDVSGVGSVTPRVVTSDARGGGAFTYVGDKPGAATLSLSHPYERPEGTPALAAGDILLTVEVGSGVPAAEAGSDVLVEVRTSTVGVVAESRLYSCGGLGGSWQGESSLTFDLPEVRGTLSGQGGFAFPPEPASGERADARWSMDGTLVLPEVGGDVAFSGEWTYEALLVQADDEWTLAGSGGTVLGSVVATIPDVGRITIPMSWPIEHGPPAEVQFVGALPACAP